MSLHAFAVAFGYLGAALGVAMVVPQILRTLRHPAMPGVSALSWSLTALACTSWLLYGTRTGELPQIPGNVLLASGAALVVLLVPAAASVPTRFVGLVACGVVLAGLAAVGPVMLIGGVAFAIGVVSGLPQTVRSLGRRRGGTSAVSLPSWSMRVASQLSWLIYAVAVHDHTVMISAIFIMSNALLVLGAELFRRPSLVLT